MGSYCSAFSVADLPFLILRSNGQDDTVQLQDAIDRTFDEGGGEIQLEGTFRISSAIDMVDKDGVVLSSANLLPAIILQSNLTTPIIRVGGSYLQLSNLQLKYETQATNAAAIALQIEGILSFSEFTNLYIWNCTRGIAYGGVQSPTGEFSNNWQNIRIGPFAASGITLIPTATQGTGSTWSNIYISNFTGVAAGACTDYPVQITNHGGVFNQLNIEWCNTVVAVRDLFLIQQCAGLVINRLHMEGNTLPASRAFIATFTVNNCTATINGLHLFNNTAAAGNIGILRPGQGTHLIVNSVMVSGNTGIIANFYTIFDTSIATDAVVVLNGMQDSSNHLDDLSLNYAGTAFVQGYKGETAGYYGVDPIVQQTGVLVTAAGIHAALVALGLITA